MCSKYVTSISIWDCHIRLLIQLLVFTFGCSLLILMALCSSYTRGTLLLHHSHTGLATFCYCLPLSLSLVSTALISHPTRATTSSKKSCDLLWRTQKDLRVSTKLKMLTQTQWYLVFLIQFLCYSSTFYCNEDNLSVWWYCLSFMYIQHWFQVAIVTTYVHHVLCVWDVCYHGYRCTCFSLHARAYIVVIFVFRQNCFIIYCQQ